MPRAIPRSLARAALLWVALGAASCAQATQIVVVVDSDLLLDTVDVVVSSTHSPPTRATADFTMPGAPGLPLTLAIYPRASADIDVFVTVTGTMMDGTTIERDVRTRFVPGSSRMLRVLLAARCLGRLCDAGETCDETGCRAIAIEGSTLPAWTGSAPALDGMSACAAVDETCNGEDDDCDLMVDEDFALATDGANCGACGHTCPSGSCANGFCAGEEIAALATGGAHTCAASANGALTCWGWNDQDQLGTEDYEAVPYPLVVEGAAGVAVISAGALHTCTVDDAGRCGCFGDGMDGALGRGTNLDSASLLSVSGASTYASVVAGVGATCAIDGASALHCWGANDHGQLGDGSRAPSSMPGGITLSDVAAVSMGFQHACAVTTAHELWCWGSNSDGQRGSGTVVTPDTPVQVPGVTDAIGVACGRTFTCFLHMDGTIECMGDGTLGQLGDGNGTSSTTPVLVREIMDATQITAASAGTHACARRSTGLVACWGGNVSGQLGDGSTTMRPAPVMVPMPVDVDAVAAGGIADDGTGHTCALDAEGRVWCWGDAALGQLGSRDYVTRSMPALALGRM